MEKKYHQKRSIFLFTLVQNRPINTPKKKKKKQKKKKKKNTQKKKKKKEKKKT